MAEDKEQHLTTARVAEEETIECASHMDSEKEAVLEACPPEMDSFSKQETEQEISHEISDSVIIPETQCYQISTALYEEAYGQYQRRMIYPRSRIFQLILLLLAVDFGYHGALHPDNALYFVLLLVCLALIGILWYNPRKQKRVVMDVVREIAGDAYTFCMDDEKMTIRMAPAAVQDAPQQSETAPTVLYYDKKLRVEETEHLFLLCQGKQMFYVLPKHALYDRQAILVRETLQEKLGHRFREN